MLKCLKFSTVDLCNKLWEINTTIDSPIISQGKEA